jgi:glutathione synthase/RimK-type ligase-like ATP-grasp enzyme
MKKQRHPCYDRYISEKMAKTRAICVSQAVREHVPETKVMKKDTLYRMLHKYRMVYVKPNVGSYGIGVMKVEWKKSAQESPYRYQIDTRKKRFEDFSSMFTAIRKDSERKSYLVQRGIDLLKHRGKRFDIRVMVQQTPKSSWETTGVIGRVAHPKKIVTNFHNGGKLTPVEKLLSQYLASDERQRYILKLQELGQQVAKTMQAKYRGIKEIGVDVAIDQELKPWILEVNTCPDPFIFRRLKDKRIFRKICRYAKAYKRIK